MADAVVQVPPDSTGKMLDAESLTVGANTVHRQRFELSGAAAAAIAAIANAAPGGTEFGLITRPIMPATTTVATADSTASGSVTAAQPAIGTPVANATVTLACAGNSAAVFAVTGTGVGTTWVVDASLDGTNWFAWNFVNPVSGAILASIAATSGIWQIGTAGLQSVRIRASAYTSGTATVTARASNATHLISADNSLLVNQGTAGSVPGRWFVQPTDGSFVQSFTTINSVGTAYQTNDNQTGTVLAATAASGTGVTLTIPAGAAGVTNYLMWLQIDLYAAAALTGGGTPILVTTTGMVGTPTFAFATVAAIGTHERQDYHWSPAIRGTAAATAMTVVCPATTNVIWRVTAQWHTGP